MAKTYLDTFTRYFPQNVSRYKILDTLLISSIFRYRYKILLKILFFKTKEFWHFHYQIAININGQNIENWALKLKESPSKKIFEFFIVQMSKMTCHKVWNCILYLSFRFQFFKIQMQDTFTKMYLDTRYRYFSPNVSRYRYKYLVLAQKMYLRYKVSKIPPSLSKMISYIQVRPL